MEEGNSGMDLINLKGKSPGTQFRNGFSNIESSKLLMELHSSISDKKLKDKISNYINDQYKFRDVRTQVLINGEVIIDNFFKCIEYDETDPNNSQWHKGADYLEDATLEQLDTSIDSLMGALSFAKHIRDYRAKELNYLF